MSPSEPQLLSLQIQAATPLTEISISDAQFRKVPLPTNTSPIELKLPQGVYQVGFRDGTSIQQELVILAPDQQQPAVVTQKARPWSQEHDAEFDEAAPQQASRLLVIIRGAADDPSGSSVGITGLSVVDEHGTPALAEPASVRDTSTRLPFDVAPGYYRLRLETGLDDQAIETPIVVCPGWSIRVSCRSRPYRPGDYRADLTKVQVRMHPTDGSRHRSREERELETNALTSLAGGRTLSGRAFNDLLRQKFVNPMFGLYAGYLLRGDNPDEIQTLAEVVANLDALVRTGPDYVLATPDGFQHPDVEALKLRLRILRKEPIEDVPVLPLPPMLLAAWRTILQVAAHSKKAIPEGSLSDRISSNLIAADASMVWVVQPELTTAAEPVAAGLRTISSAAPVRRRGRGATVRPAGNVEAPAAAPEDAGTILTAQEGINIITTALRNKRLRDWFRIAGGMDAGAKEEHATQDRTAPLISESERMVAQAIHPIAPNEQFQSIFERTRAASSAEDHIRTPSDLALGLRLPVVTVERAIESISKTLLRQGQLLGFNLRERGDHVASRADHSL